MVVVSSRGEMDGGRDRKERSYFMRLHVWIRIESNWRTGTGVEGNPIESNRIESLRMSMEWNGIQCNIMNGRAKQLNYTFGRGSCLLCAFCYCDCDCDCAEI